MSKVSVEFGEMIKSFLHSKGLTFRAAAFSSGISAAYWKDMSDGRVPSEEYVFRIAQAYGELDENKLRVAAGYPPKIESMDPVEAVEFALRGQPSISEQGKQQIVDFVREIRDRYGRA